MRGPTLLLVLGATVLVAGCSASSPPAQPATAPATPSSEPSVSPPARWPHARAGRYRPGPPPPPTVTDVGPPPAPSASAASPASTYAPVATPVLAARPAPPKPKRLSDAQVAQRLIQDSIESYPGNCPCPYDTDRIGRSCGRRSAWSKPGGYEPLCYRDDVTAGMILEWRARNESAEAP